MSGDLILVEREITRAGTTFWRKQWVKPEEREPGDKEVTDTAVIDKFKAERAKRKVYEDRFRAKKKADGTAKKPEDPPPPLPEPVLEKPPLPPPPPPKPEPVKPKQTGDFGADALARYPKDTLLKDLAKTYARLEETKFDSWGLATAKDAMVARIAKDAMVARIAELDDEAEWHASLDKVGGKLPGGVAEHGERGAQAESDFVKAARAHIAHTLDPDGKIEGTSIKNLEVFAAVGRVEYLGDGQYDMKSSPEAKRAEAESNVLMERWLDQPAIRERLQNVVQEFSRAIPGHEYRPVGLVAISVAPRRDTAVGWYRSAEGKLTLTTRMASSLISAMKAKTYNAGTPQGEAIRVLAHELGHAGSHPDYKYEVRNDNAPHKAMEEATTEVLAQLTAARVANHIGLVNTGQHHSSLVVGAGSYLTERHGKSVSVQGWEQGRSSAYMNWTGRFIGAVALASNATTPEGRAADLEKWSLACKHTRGSMRFNRLADGIISNHLPRTHAHFGKARELVGNILRKHMANGTKLDVDASSGVMRVWDNGARSDALDMKVVECIKKVRKMRVPKGKR
jgi:hypothetical protein